MAASSSRDIPGDRETRFRFNRLVIGIPILMMNPNEVLTSGLPCDDSNIRNRVRCVHPIAFQSSDDSGRSESANLHRADSLLTC